MLFNFTNVFTIGCKAKKLSPRKPDDFRVIFDGYSHGKHGKHRKAKGRKFRVFRAFREKRQYREEK